MSISGRSTPLTSCPARSATSIRSVPSMPAAPITRIRTRVRIAGRAALWLLLRVRLAVAGHAAAQHEPGEPGSDRHRREQQHRAGEAVLERQRDVGPVDRGDQRGQQDYGRDDRRVPHEALVALTLLLGQEQLLACPLLLAV